MKHEKIIKRPTGESVLIEVEFYADFMRNEFKYSALVYRKEKGKRLWQRNVSTEKNYSLNRPEDPNGYATPEEILEAKMEMWNKVKPT